MELVLRLKGAFANFWGEWREWRRSEKADPAGPGRRRGFGEAELLRKCITVFGGEADMGFCCWRCFG